MALAKELAPNGYQINIDHSDEYKAIGKKIYDWLSGRMADYSGYLDYCLNTSASDLQEIADRQKKGLPSCGWKYHEFKAEQLKAFGKLIDKKLKKL